MSVDVAVIGAGTAGLYALREIRRAGRSFVLIDHGPLGTTCARVGCMPSKAALHAAERWAAREELDDLGVSGAETMSLDMRQFMAHIREHRDRFSAGASAKAREAAWEHLIMGSARLLSPTLVSVQSATTITEVEARAVVIAVGSRPSLPGFLEPVRELVVTTDEFFELDTLPTRVGVLGLGGIGLELGLAMSRAGIEVLGADMAELPAGISDPVIGKRARARFGGEMDFWLGASVQVERAGQGVRLSDGTRNWEAPLLLAALGRRPNTDSLDLEQAGIGLGPRGSLSFDPVTMQVGDLPVFVAGDASGYRPLMHEAADEGAIAGYNAARLEVMRFRRRVPLGIIFSNPDIATVGVRLDSLDADAIFIGIGAGQANGRSRILDAEDNVVRIYADRQSGRLLGGSIFARHGEHLAHLLAWAIQRGETAESLLELPFYHPTVEEMLQSALQDVVRQMELGHAHPVGLFPEGGET